MLNRKLLGTLMVIAATAIVPGSAAAHGSAPDPVRPSLGKTSILATAGPSGTGVKAGQDALGTRAGGEVVGLFDIPAELTSARVPTESNAAVTDGTSNTIAFAPQSIAADGQGARQALTFDSHTRPHADGIIAILIGAIASTDDRRTEDDENVPHPRP